MTLHVALIGAQSSEQTTRTVLRYTFVAATLFFTFIAVNNNTAPSALFDGLPWIILGSFVYLLTAELFLRLRFVQLVNWMLVIFFIFLASLCLVAWSLHSSMGIITLCFAVTLPGILMGSMSIFPVLVVSVGMLFIVSLVHTQGIFQPNLTNLSESTSIIETLGYVAAITSFSLATWISRRQREKSLQRVLRAEYKLQSQKESLVAELEKESAILRLTQLEQTRELHKFALLGQNAAATLHELSTHLSILNIDIDDLRQHNNNSNAIQNAADSIDHINKMVRKARHHLNSYDHKESFNALQMINLSIKDLQTKCTYHHVKLTKRHSYLKQGSIVSGSPTALMQIITILLNNAVDACYDAPNPRVTIATKSTASEVIITVSDSGPGIDPEVRSKLFKPLVSTKPSGMGVGLYIANHLVVTQFNGTIELVPSNFGAQFRVTIPKRPLEITTL